MPTCIALLRAVNVGGRTVRMDELRRIFEAAGFANVATLIASGNVIFDAATTDTRAVEREVEALLERALGYPVATFIRTPAEVARIAACRPFPDAGLAASGATLYVAFTHEAPSPDASARLDAACTTVDELVAHDREIYWLRRVPQSDRAHPSPPLEKLLGAPVTIRNMNTVQRLAARYAPR